jgi:metal transporter CNNM
MPPLTRSHPSTRIPTVLSLSKLLTLVPPLLTGNTARQHLKRGGEWATVGITLAADTAAPIEPEDPPDSPEFWWKLSLSVVLVLAGGVFAGYVLTRLSDVVMVEIPRRAHRRVRLTLALMGSDDLNLRVLSTSSDDPRERKAAAKVLRLLARGRHWVLVVLLLGNVVRRPFSPSQLLLDKWD